MLKKKQVKIEGRIITYFETGKGRSAVFLPGLGSDCSLWRDVLPKLSKHFHCFAFSFPTYGTYNSNHQKYTLHTLPFLLEELIKLFKIHKPVLIGHSLGGIVNIEYTAFHPKSVSKLIMVSTPLTNHLRPIPLMWKAGVEFARKTKRSEEIISWVLANREVFEHLVEILFPGKEARRVLAGAEHFLRAHPIKSIANCFHDLFNQSFRSFVEKIRVPALFIYGSKDKPIEIFNGKALCSLIPEAKIFSFPCGHFVPSDMPEKLSETILDFLNSGTRTAS